MNEHANQGVRLGPILPWLALGAVVLAAIIYMERVPAEKIGPSHLAVGKKLTRLTVTPLTGNPPQISVDDLLGKVTLINYWGTWCPPCIQEFPHLVDLEKAYQDRSDFRFVSVSAPGGSADKQVLARDTEAFLKAYGADLPTYAEADLTSAPAAFAAAGLLDAYPTTLIVDRQGTIRGVWQGYRPGYERQMADLVKELLKETAR